jgi:hypothetical protein
MGYELMTTPQVQKMIPKATHQENDIKDLLIYIRAPFTFGFKLLNYNSPISSLILQKIDL